MEEREVVALESIAKSLSTLVEVEQARIKGASKAEQLIWRLSQDLMEEHNVLPMQVRIEVSSDENINPYYKISELLT